jgi:hypothetical protein
LLQLEGGFFFLGGGAQLETGKEIFFLNVWLVGLFVGICLAMRCCFQFYSHIFCLDAIVIFILKY